MLLIKKIYRLSRIIIHAVSSGFQVLFYFRGSESHPGNKELAQLDDRQQAMARRINLKFIQLLNIEQDIYGQPEAGNVLMVANHISWKDILLLNSLYHTRFVAKSEIEKWPLVGWLSRKVGTLFINRSSVADVRQLNSRIADSLSRGEKVTLFPEGTTTDGSQIKSFYPGLFQAAINAQADVQPVVIVYKVEDKQSPHIPYSADVNMLENLWTVLGFDRIVAEIHFTQRISVKDKSRKELSDLAFQQMTALINQRI